MNVFGKTVVAFTALYFVAGLMAVVPALGEQGLVQLLAVVYLLCIVAAVIGCVLVFVDRLVLARWLLLLPLFATSIAVGSARFGTVFPSIIKFPLTFTIYDRNTPTSFIGLNLVPLLFLVAINTLLRLAARRRSNRLCFADSSEDQSERHGNDDRD